MGRRQSKKASTKKSTSARHDLENTTCDGKPSGDNNAECTNSQNTTNAHADIAPGCSSAASSSSQSEPTIASVQQPNISTTIPEFDPSNDKITIEYWLSKVNECAEKNSWDEDYTIRFAFSKVSECVKVWLQSQTCISHSWVRWQELLCKAFPSTTDYAELLTAMLVCRLKYDDDLEEYFHNKMALLYACALTGDKAVDSIVHGIADYRVRAAAAAADCSEPEALLYVLKDIMCQVGETSSPWCV